MRTCTRIGPVASGLIATLAAAASGAPSPLPGTETWTGPVDLTQASVAQWDAYYLARIEAARETRVQLWHRDGTSAEAYDRSVEPNRERLRQRVGAIEPAASPPVLELLSPAGSTGPVASSSRFGVWTVRWSVLEGVYAEGLLLRPTGSVKAAAVVVPDADQSPEMLAGVVPGLSPAAQVARRLAESGVLVLVPVLVDRRSTYAGDEQLQIYTNQTDREWLSRQATEVGRSLIGYEVEKVRAAVEWLKNAEAKDSPVRVGVAGYGEGGLIAFYSAALDPEIAACWVSGYFQPRERVWTEPLYRSVWGLLEEFGDAEIATLVAPRALIVEAGRGPEIPSAAPGSPRAGRPRAKDARALRSAAPGALTSPSFGAVKAEWERARRLAGPEVTERFRLVGGEESPPGARDAAASVSFGDSRALGEFLDFIGAPPAAPSTPLSVRALPSADWREERQHRTVRELQEHIQALVRNSEQSRDLFFWSKLDPKSPRPWADQVRPFRQVFAEELIGKLPEDATPLRPRTRLAPEFSTASYAAYEVVLEVYPGIQTWGYLLLPADLRPGERRAVVVCQHGANGVPTDTFDRIATDRAYRIYQNYAGRLAAEGFVVFAPSDPNSLAGDSFGLLSRKAGLLRQSLFSIFTLDHARILRWLKSQPFVDSSRLAFYGMSYGGKAAMRLVPQLEDYCLAICSGDFHAYAANMTSVQHEKNEGEMFTGSFETLEFNLAPTFDYAEMAAMIAPRPFMVEQGYQDHGLTLDWTAGEYAKVQRLYFRLGIPDRTAIEYFDGPHQVHAEGTFAFLRRFLGPAPASPPLPAR